MQADFECLRMAFTSAVAASGDHSSHDSYHHVWTPELRYGKFKSHGLDLLYEVEGRGSETIVIVHGGPGLPHEYFHPVFSNLSRYAKLVYFDRRADIASVQKPAQIISMKEMAEDLEALRIAIGLERMTVLGHSFGGNIALKYALMHPDRVERLILVNTSSYVENPNDTDARVMSLLTPSEISAMNALEGPRAARTACERVGRRYRSMYPYMFHHSMDAASQERDYYSVYFDMLARRLLVAGEEGGFDARGQLEKIKVPVLVLTGKHDVVTPPEFSTEMAKELPHSRLVVLDKSGHFSFIEENFLFTEWVRQFVAATNDWTPSGSTVVAERPRVARPLAVTATARKRFQN